ncbi:unnamed protein product, partial [Leptidea sinapis]
MYRLVKEFIEKVRKPIASQKFALEIPKPRRKRIYYDI